MRARTALSASSLLAGALIAGSAAAWLSEFGIEGMRVVSTAASEVRATVSPDGQRIVWGSTDREGGAGGWDLWQARLKEGRWQDATPLAINSSANDFDPMFSADGRWLYFFSNRDGGIGGDDLYRAVVHDDGYGSVENLGPAINTAGDEWAPTPGADGRHLLFASDGHGGAGGLDLFESKRSDDAWSMPAALSALNTPADEASAALLPTGVVVFERAGVGGTARLHRATCGEGGWTDAGALALSFNTEAGTTRRPVPDWNAPEELLVAGSARAPRAGGLDLYRMRAPRAAAGEACE